MRYLGCLLVLLFLTSAADTIHAAPIADDGVMNLRLTPLEQAGPVQLKGHWHFYWGKFYEPGAFPAGEPMSLPTPKAWGSAHPGIDDRGYGTYRLRIQLSERDVGRTLGIYIPSIASAYRLYVNGEMRASVGQTGTSPEQMKPGALPRSLYLTSDRQELELVVQVSNYSQRKGGIWDGFKLGTAAQIAAEREQRVLFQSFIGTGLLLMGIYHIGLYFVRADRSTLYFGLASLGLSLRTAFTGDMLAYRLFPAIPWEIGVKVEYLSVYCGISFLLLYFYHLYEKNLHRAISYGLALTLIGISMPILVLPAVIYTEWLVAYQLVVLAVVLYIVYGLVRAAIYRYTGARLNLTAGILFLATVINDILYYNYVLDTVDLVAFGLFLFVFTQMFMLAKKFASSYREVERLTGELKAINENLEAIVEKRTSALRKLNEQLSQVERARKDFLSNITHELGNPLTSILGYLRRLKDGASKDLSDRHIEIAYQKALKLERLTGDLRQLVKLEHNQLTYQMRTLPLQELFGELDRSFDWDALPRKVEIVWKAPVKGQYAATADVHRIEQVFVNLVGNALAYTEAGDRITIVGRVYACASACAVTVQDTGIGIRKEDQTRIFDRFYRIPRPGSDSLRDGTGLGLPIAKAIIEAHRGRIGVRSKLGSGSTFHFIIPLTKVDCT